MKHLKNVEPFFSIQDFYLSLLYDLSKKQYKKDDMLIKQGVIIDNLIFLKSGVTASIYEN